MACIVRLSGMASRGETCACLPAVLCESMLLYHSVMCVPEVCAYWSQARAC